MILLLALLAVAAARVYPPGTEPGRVYPPGTEGARVWPDGTGHNGYAKDGRPENAHVYPPGTEPANNTVK